MFQLTLISKVEELIHRFGYSGVSVHDVLNWKELKINLSINLETKQLQIFLGVYHKNEAILARSSEFGEALTAVLKAHEDYRRRTGYRPNHQKR